MNEPLVSIIVPVYNAEKYLKRCIESVLHQDYKNFELLLIDDGSTDHSLAVCQEYAKNDTRVRVRHKENSGVSNSRNLALDLAKGIFVQFLDSDDWITPDSTKLLVRASMEHRTNGASVPLDDSFQDCCDLVIADFYRVVDERLSKKGDIEDDVLLTREQFADHMMENPADFYYGVLWNKLYKRELIEKAGLRMNPEISWCEDFLFNLEYIRHAKSFYALQAPVYYYVKTKGSLVTQGLSISKTLKMKLSVFEYYNEFYKNIYDEDDYDDKRLQVYGFFFSTAKDGLVAPAILPGSRKLGNERIMLMPDAVSGAGPVCEIYRLRKLLERFCHSAAMKNDLSLPEMTVLLFLSQGLPLRTIAAISDLSGLSKYAVSMALQKLVRAKYLKIDTLKKGESLYTILPAADTLLKDLTTVQSDYYQTCLHGLTEYELEEYRSISGKIKENLKEALL